MVNQEENDFHASDMSLAFEATETSAERMIEKAAETAEMLKAMSNRYRLTILCCLLNGEHSVGELQRYLGLKQSIVSQHLAVLRNHHIVETRRDGQTIYYHIDSEVVIGILNYLCREPSTLPSE